ncbi:glycosyltransferase family 4 protein [Thermococcus sp.]
METLRVALASDWYYPKIGGVAVHIHNLAIQLSRLGHEVDILTNDVKTGKEEELEELGIGLLKVPGRVLNGLSLNVGVFSRGASALAPLLRDYDVIHGQHAFTPLSLKATSAAKKMGKVALITTHSVDFENSNAIKLLARTSFPYYKYYLGTPHRIVAVSKASREFIKKFTNVPVEVIPNGIDTSFFHNGWDKEAVKDELGLSGKIILYVGRIEPRKGLSFLISAMKDVNGTLLIAGKGSTMPLLRERVRLLGLRDKVRFLGNVDYSELPKLYGASDVFVLPSLSEAFGIVLLEAMASGVPVVGTSVGGIPEIIDGCGVVVPPGSSKAIARAVNLLLTDERLSKRLGTLGRKRAERLYDWSMIARKVSNLYFHVLNEVAANDGHPQL